ncbi:MAG: ExbD/TolR family protein [Burkholderiales bacterium]
MAFGGFEHGSAHQRPMAEINVIPLIDVMLVLLVIFIITAPLFSNAIKLDLPDARGSQAPAKPEAIQIAINQDGQVFWNNQKLEPPELQARLQAAAKQLPMPELHLRADKNARYEPIAQLLSVAQQNGLTKLSFVTDLPASSAPNPAKSAAAATAPRPSLPATPPGPK